MEQNDELNSTVELDESHDKPVDMESEKQSDAEYTAADIERMDSELVKLDNGELNVRNKDTMARLLKYLLEQPPYTGTFNPNTTVTISDEIFEGMDRLEKLPTNGIIVSNHTEAEITELNKRLWRLILVSQYQRSRLTREEIENDYVQMSEPRAILTTAEYDLFNYLSSSLALLQDAPIRNSIDSGEWNNVASLEGKRIGLSLVTAHKDPIKRIRSKLNLINEGAATLAHSGLVIKLSSPSGLDAALLNDNIMSAKINASVDSQGNALGSTSVYTNEILVEQAYRNLEDTNLGEITKETFEENLSLLDVEQLAAALSVVLYPTGFTIHRRCGSLNCSEVRSILINPRRTILHRTDRLTEHQLRHLTRGFSKVDISTIEAYRENLTPEVSRYVQIEDDVYLKLRVPMFSDYKRISRSWLDFISNKSLELVSGTSNEDARKAFLYDSFAKSTLMVYSPWVEGVYVKTEDNDYIPHLVRLKKAKGVTENAIIEADLQLDEFISDFRANPDLQAKILEKITDFIKDSALTVHVLPKTRCAACGGEHLPEGDEIESECISYSPSELFFTLLHLKTVSVSE